MDTITQVPDAPVRVWLHPTPAARAAYLAATGRDTPDGALLLTVPAEVLSVEVRTALSAATFASSPWGAKPAGEMGRHLTVDGPYAAPLIPRTSEEWDTLVAGWSAARATHEAKAEVARLAQEGRLNAAVALLRAAAPEELIEARGDRHEAVHRESTYRLANWARARGADVGTSTVAAQELHDALPKDAANLVEAERLAQERTAEAQATATASRETRDRAQLEAERAAEAERITWIAEHGSSRLRRLVAEGIEHDGTYRSERLHAERSGWRYNREPLPGYSSEPRNPPMDALELLDEARASVPEAKLVYWTVGAETDEYGDVTIESVRGYTCAAKFLGREIVYHVSDDGTPPVVV